MGSRVFHAEDDPGGAVVYPDVSEWTCDCGGTTVLTRVESYRLEVYGDGFLELGQAIQCHQCGGRYRFSPTVSFVGGRVPHDVGGFIEDDEDEMMWEDDDDVSWD